jgi:phosphonoacetaldehyde hydrolase
MVPFVRTKPYTGGLQAAIFDWAGTMVDHGCVGPVASFLDVFKKNGVEITLAEAREPMGLDKKDHIRALIGMDRVAKEWEKAYGRKPGRNRCGRHVSGCRGHDGSEYGES